MSVELVPIADRQAAAAEALAAQAPLRREDILRALLPPLDLEYAENSGLLDLFYYNPETGTDGLVHILGGEVKMSVNNVPLPGGFHHEPSVPAIWGEDGERFTRVLPGEDGEHPAESSLMMPYAAGVMLGGISKMTFKRTRRGTEFEPAQNTFFPREYDALGVLQGIRLAYENRDTQNEVLALSTRNRPRVTSYGPMPLLDGSEVPIKFVLDFESDKIIAAMPKLPPNYADRTPLTQAEMWRLITTPVVAEENQ